MRLPYTPLKNMSSSIGYLQNDVNLWRLFLWLRSARLEEFVKAD